MRSFTARDLITWPRLTAVEAFVLTTEILTAADAQIETLKALGSSLPVAIDRSRKRLVTAHALYAQRGSRVLALAYSRLTHDE